MPILNLVETSISGTVSGQLKEAAVAHKYVSRRMGEDFDTCGTKLQPCRTLYRALNTTESEIYLHIDGNGTQQDPYKCENFPKLGKRSFKNITMKSTEGHAYIFCQNRIYFNYRGKPSHVTLSELVFVDTPLILDDCSISIFNCRFLNHTGFAAVDITVSKQRKTAVFIQGTSFGNIGAACLSVKPIRKRMASSTIICIYNTTFFHIGSQMTYPAVNTETQDVNIKCKDVIYARNKVAFIEFNDMYGGNSYFSKRVVVISSDKSVFVENTISAYSVLFPLSVINLGFFHSGFSCTLNITNTYFGENDNGVTVSNNVKVLFNNVTMTLITGKALYLQTATWGTPRRPYTLQLKNCYFVNNTESVFIETYKRLLSLFVEIQDTIFQGNHPSRDSATAIRIISLLREKNRHLPAPLRKYWIFLERVKIKGISGKALSLELQASRYIFVQIKSSQINNINNAINSESKGPIILLDLPSAEVRVSNSSETTRVLSLRHTPQHPGKNEVEFVDVNFENNTGFGSTILVNNMNVTFLNSTFKDNFAQDHGGAISVARGKGRLQIRNTIYTASLSKQELHFEKPTRKRSLIVSFMRGASLVIQNSSFLADDNPVFYTIFSIDKGDGQIFVDHLTSIQCPVDYQLKLDIPHNERIEKGSASSEINITSQTLYCQRCAQGFYSLEGGYSRGLSIVKTASCFPCPYGASCIHNISSKTNFWGYMSSTHPPTLEFLPCPHEYCHRYHNRRTTSYNSCYGNRAGVLCGQCSKGYTEEMFTNDCREDTSCKDAWFWPLTTVYILTMTLYFVFKPPVISFLCGSIFWFRKHNASQQTHRHKHQSSGYLKVVFYFYQIAELVILKSHTDLMNRVFFLSPITAFFNFKFRLLNNSLGCPFPGLTVVTKELFLSLKVITVIAFLFPIYAAHKVVNKARQRDNPRLTSYVAVVMEILLVGYERLAEMSLKLLHCLQIGNQLRLFYDGNIQCWQWWQHIFIAYVIIFVVPFVLVLYWGSVKLHKNSISGKELLCSCIAPLPFLVYWSARHYKKVETNVLEETVEEIKEVFHGPFQPPVDEHPGTLYWESVLIGRRLILLCLYTFITDPMIRLFSMDCACLVIFVHHLIKRPYRDAKVNICESISLLALVVLSSISNLEAAFISAAVEPTGQNETHFKVLQWIEIAIVGFLPSSFLVIVLFAVLSQTVRVVMFVLKKCSTLADKLRNIYCEFRSRYVEYRGHHVLEFCSDVEDMVYDQQ